MPNSIHDVKNLTVYISMAAYDNDVSEDKAMVDIEKLQEDFDKWESRDRRERFLRRMEHKLHNKELATRQ